MKKYRSIIPWLNQEIQKNIYAESIEVFTWWNDDYEKIISQEDIESAKKIFTQKLKTEVIESIKKNILQENRKNNSEIDILSWGKNIHYSDPIIQIEPWINPWDVKDNFSISWNITAYVYIYSKVKYIYSIINNF